MHLPAQINWLFTRVDNLDVGFFRVAIARHLLQACRHQLIYDTYMLSCSEVLHESRGHGKYVRHLFDPDASLLGACCGRQHTPVRTAELIFAGSYHLDQLPSQRNAAPSVSSLQISTLFYARSPF